MAHENLRSDFTEHDSFLHALLGMVSLSLSVEKALMTPAGADGAPREGDEEVTMLMLGLISLRGTVLGALGPLRTGAVPAPRSVDEAPRDLLR